MCQIKPHFFWFDCFGIIKKSVIALASNSMCPTKLPEIVLFLESVY